MTVIICVDDKMGMSFLGKRLSKDRLLRQRVTSLAADSTLRMDTYTASQFEEPAALTVSENFLSDGNTGDWCFVEKCDISPFKDKIHRIILYKWNRHYPSDVKFTFPLEESGFVLRSCSDFSGSSHETITEEIWTR